MTTSPQHAAIATLCNASFHQSFWLPSSASHDRLRVTFATTTNFSNPTLPVILLCGAMFGSRWNAVDIDYLANQTGVRCICVDRPGRGGSHPISPLSARVPLWIETVPLLLTHLGVQHLAGLLSHSAGTIYVLNTLYHLRHLLCPKQSLVAIVAPYIDNAHSRARLTNILVKFPTRLVRAWDPLARFLMRRVFPVVDWSRDVLDISSGRCADAVEVPSDTDREYITAGEKYGVSDEVGQAIEKNMTPFLLAENTSAVAEEALLCLKKGGVGLWGVAEDYERFVMDLAGAERARRRTDNQAPKLRVKVWYAESDVMSGKGGQNYFDACWKQAGVDEVVDFESEELAGTNHDSAIGDQKKGALRAVFELIGSNNQDAR